MIPFLLTVSAGIMLSALYLVDIQLPVWISVPAVTGIAGFILWHPPVRSCRVSFLPRIATLLYVMPFLHLWGYVFSDDYIFFPGHTLSYAYQRNSHMILGVATIGLVGIMGFTTGLMFSHFRRDRILKAIRKPREIEDKNALGLVSSVVITALVLVCAWLDSPENSILSKSYSDIWSQHRSQTIGFAGAGILGYALLALLVIDALKENNFKLKLLKFGFAAGTFTYILIFFQILRGNRDILGLIFALISLYLLSAARMRAAIMPSVRAARSAAVQLTSGLHRKVSREVRRRILLAALVLGSTFVTFQILGEWRNSASSGHTASEAMTGIIREGAIFHGTWTAVLLGPLSTVGDLEVGLKSYRFGATYRDIVLSLPPGPICKLFGYTRPFESDEELGRGLAHEMTFGLGGTHVTVTPLLNFSAPGVFVVLFLIGWLIGNIEILANVGSTWHVFLHCVFLAGLPGFFWYGEMYIIRALMSAYLVWFGYNFVLPNDSHRIEPRFQLSFPALIRSASQGVAS